MKIRTGKSKRLRKDVKRRQRYVENLDRSIAGMADDTAAVDALERVRAVERAAIDEAELEIVRLEQAEWEDLHGHRMDPEQEARSRRAMTAMKGRFMVDRVAAVVERFGVVVPHRASSVGDHVAAIEARLGIRPPRGATVGRRMDAIERLVVKPA